MFGLRNEQAGENYYTAGRNNPRHGRREGDEWARQDVGEDQVIARPSPCVLMREPIGDRKAHARSHAVETRIGARDFDRYSIVIGRRDRGARQASGCRDCEHAGTATQIQHAAERSQACKAAQRLEATMSGGVVSRSKCLAGFDFDCVRRARDALAIVAAVDRETSCRHGRQGGLR